MHRAYLDTELRRRVALVTFRRPETLNAIDGEGVRELHAALEHLCVSPEVDVIILTGEGRAFLAGADIAFMKGLDRRGAERFIADGHALCSLIEQVPQVVIAAVNGHALGGGTEIALACDLVYASESATFGQPEVRLGIIPGFGGTQRLPRVIGRNAAREWIYTGDVHGAREAMELGLVNQVFADDRLLPRTFEIATDIASASPGAVAEAKRCIHRGTDGPLDLGLERERRAFDRVFVAGDRLEGMTAFLEKRRPVFRKVEDGHDPD